MKLTDFIPEYEELTGKPVDPVIVRFAEGLDKLCEQTERWGREDRNEGKLPCDAGYFHRRSARVLRDDLSLVDFVAEFMHEAYLRGYNAGEAAGGEK